MILIKRNVIIHEKLYTLPEFPIADSGFSGSVYHLKTENVDFSVKLYHPTPLYQDIEKWYPTIEELNIFIEASSMLLPILVSQFAVYSENNDYIGCATPFLYSSRGKVEDLFFQLPRELVLNQILSFFQVIPIVNSYGIVLEDVNIPNSIWGFSQNLKEGLYIFDDSSYSIGADINENDQIPNLFCEDIFSYYDFSSFDKRIPIEMFRDMRKRTDYIDFFIEKSNGYSTLGDFFEDYAKTLKKKF